jgi:CheY-like chemotaxis protein
MKNYKELIILIAEDDDGHAELIESGLRDSGVNNTIKRFENGEDIWNFLQGNSSEIRDENSAYLVLLDINMPLMDGVEVLKNIKSNESLKDIPVIMLTTTDNPQEVEACYKLGCNFYVTKPIKFDKFAEILKRLGMFLNIVKIIN